MNWARIVLGALLLASKVWDDHAVWNADFCQIFPDVDVMDMNELERWYMSAIRYNVSIKSSQYTRTYFELRDMMERSGRIKILKPMTVQDANKLEERVLSRSTYNKPPGTPTKEHSGSRESDGAIDKNPSRSLMPTEKLPDLLPSAAAVLASIDRKMKRSLSDYIFVPTKPPAMVM
ncbi:hypothetical protein HK102_003890 [Quaeritorhiza haematococci]|nr:hypothetical protein HK102_003890 [Quaeritorhiza haematococci]